MRLDVGVCVLYEHVNKCCVARIMSDFIVHVSFRFLPITFIIPHNSYVYVNMSYVHNLNSFKVNAWKLNSQFEFPV